MIHILFVAASIREDLDFPEKESYAPINMINESLITEYKHINSVLLKSEHRNKFDLRFIPSVTSDEFTDSLLQYKPDILHFSGMGVPDGILMQDEHENVKILSPDLFAETINISNPNKNIRCVVMTAPYTLRHAEILSQSIDCTIGFNFLSNKQAELFGKFYHGLGSGLSVNDAFELACSSVKLKITDQEIAVKLKYAPGVDPSKIYLANRS